MTRLIFVPGIKGTELFNGKNKVWLPKSQKDLEFLRVENKLLVGEPLGIFNAIYKKFNIYKKIITKLNQWFSTNVETFGYDWRDDVYNNRDLLVDEIKDLYEKNKVEEKITIVAHSMGGIIAKLAIHKLEEQGLDLVERLITIGTPWLGAPEALKVLVHGEFGIFRGTDTIVKFKDDNSMRELARQFPSAYQLLPNKEYYGKEDGKYVRTIDKKDVSFDDITSKVKTFFNEWDKEKQVYKMTDVWMKYVSPVHKDMLVPLPKEIEHHCIIGIEEPTLYALSMETGEKRKDYKGEFTFKNGDGVVPLISANALAGPNTKKYYLKGEHPYLCSQKGVINLLENLLHNKNNELPEGVTTIEPKNVELTKGKLAIIKCPVDSTILDNNGAYLAGVFDPSKEVSEYLNDEKVNYFTIGESKFFFIDKDCNFDLNFEIMPYSEGITDVSVKLYEDEKTTELDFASIPVTSKSSAKLFLPLSEADISDAATVLHDGKVSKKVIRTYKKEQLIIDEKIPTFKVHIKGANEHVKRTKHNQVYNGNVILEIKATEEVNLNNTQNVSIKEIMYIVNDEPAKFYEGPVELETLKNGENIISIIGKDIFNRPLNSVIKKVSIDKNAPITNLKLKAEPDGLIATFYPETNGTKATTKYNISYSDEIIPSEIEWKEAISENEVPIPWRQVKEKPEEFIIIKYFSINEFGVAEESQRTIQIKLGGIPALMWSEATTTNLTPKEILSHLLNDFTGYNLDELDVYALMGERKKGGYSPINFNDGIKDDVKGVRFTFPHITIDVMYAEPYSLYFSGPPSEVLRKGENYNFKFELITERTKERINYTNPHVTLRKNVKKKSSEKRIPIPIQEKNGTYYGEFTVDETFVEDRHKLVITDNKNTDPALRVIILIMDDVEQKE